MTSRPGNKRPSLTRAETIESCNSDDLVTVLEVHDRRPYKIMDRSRAIKKGVMAESLTELIERGKEKLNYPIDKEVYVVLEEDGTEIDEEEYFQTLPENTLLMLLHVGDKWSPFGPPFTPPSSSKSRHILGSESFDLTHDVKAVLSSSNVPNHPGAFPKNTNKHVSSELTNLLERLEGDPSLTALLATNQLELLAQMDIDLLLLGTSASFRPSPANPSFERDFLDELQKAADQHLVEKNEIRNAVGLLQLYHFKGPSAGPGLDSLSPKSPGHGPNVTLARRADARGMKCSQK